MPTYTVVLYDGTSFQRDAESVKEMRLWLDECGYNPKTSNAPKSRQARTWYRADESVSAVGSRL